MEYIQKGNLLIYPHNHKIILSGRIREEEQANLSAVLVHFQGHEVNFFIDSDGGHVSSGIHMSDAIKLHGQVTGVVTAEAYSAAFEIFQSCSRRLIYPNGKIMTHAPTIKALRVDQENILEEAQKSLGQYYSFLEALSKRTRQNLESLKQWAKEEKCFNAQEALQLNFVDEIIKKMPQLK